MSPFMRDQSTFVTVCESEYATCVAKKNLEKLYSSHINVSTFPQKGKDVSMSRSMGPIERDSFTTFPTLSTHVSALRSNNYLADLDKLRNLYTKSESCEYVMLDGYCRV